MQLLNAASLPGGLELRAAKESDRAFMLQLFASTREYLRQLPLPEAQVSALIGQQYQLQQAHYTRQWPDAEALIIQLSGKPVGKLVVDQCETTLLVIDIALEPAVRGQGHGTAVLCALQSAAAKRRSPVRLSVDRHNVRAKQLYARLGFKITGSSETHEAMTWSPSDPAVSGDFSHKTVTAGL